MYFLSSTIRMLLASTKFKIIFPDAHVFFKRLHSIWKYSRNVANFHQIDVMRGRKCLHFCHIFARISPAVLRHTRTHQADFQELWCGWCKGSQIWENSQEFSMSWEVLKCLLTPKPRQVTDPGSASRRKLSAFTSWPFRRYAWAWAAQPWAQPEPGRRRGLRTWRRPKFGLIVAEDGFVSQLANSNQNQS